MPCQTGHIQIGTNPDGSPICVDAATYATMSQNSGQSQTGQAANLPTGTVSTTPPVTGGVAWWQTVVTALPDLLGGAASVINAGKGNAPADQITIIQNPEVEPKGKPMWGWFIVAGVVVLVVVLLMVYKRKK